MKKYIFSALLFLLTVLISVQSSYAQSNSILKRGMSSSEVSKLQNDLKALGFFGVNPTGYFGSITEESVTNLQRTYNLKVDGIVGVQTFTQINALLDGNTNISRGGFVRGQTNISNKSKITLLPWFDEVNNLFSIGKDASVIDVDTGSKFMVKRTYGTNHADVETLTAEDTRKLKEIAGGTWNWTRRAVIVEVDGYRIAASITAMPHAGRDDKPANITVNGRSEGYGTGENLDSVKGNNMDGHFDIHFLNSRTHGTNRVNEAHQDMVKKAYNSGL